MKKKYRFHWYVNLVFFGLFIFMVAFVLAVSAWQKPRPYDVVFLWSLASLSLIAAIMNLFIYYTAGDNGLFFYSFFKKIKIDWDEIEYIVLQPPLKYASVRVTILAKGKKIVISSWLKDYKEILKRVVTEARKREIEGIDREVVALLNR